MQLNQEHKDILDKAIKWAPNGQKRVYIFWFYFRRWKCHIVTHLILIGHSWMSAFELAKKTKYKEYKEMLKN